MKTQKEIEELLDRVINVVYNPSKFPGMSYEEGVRNALDWVLGNCDPADNPLD